jgi:photosystem II stability/assembly factor-like uncharacterized protein
MNRGHYSGIGRRLKPGGLALCAGLLITAVTGAALATGDLKATPQPDRSWESYYGVTILPSGRAVVAGDKGVVMTTDDGGRTWTRQTLESGPKYFDLYSVAFTPDGSRGWVVGDDGVIFRTDDRGTSWTEQKGPAELKSALLKVTVADAQKFCASGEHGVLLCTTDAGATWNFQKFKDLAFFDITYSDANNIWAVGEFATLLHSVDGGKSWQAVKGGEIGTGDPLFSIAFNGHQGLVVGLIGSSLQSNDDGKTWQERKLPIGGRSLYTVSALPSQAGEFFAAGEQGLSAVINNGEVTQVPSGVANAIAASAFSPKQGIAVGLAGTMLRSDDSGRHWRSLFNKATQLTEAQ